MAAVISIENHSITLADGVASATVNLSVGNVADCTPRISVNTQPGADDYTNFMVRARFLTGPNRLEVGRANTVGQLIIQAVVIEWDTGEVTIQSGSATFSTATHDETITAVDLTKAFALFTYEITGGDNDTVSIRAMLSSTTNLHFERDTATDTITLDWWVVEDTSSGGLFNVERVQALSIPGVTADATITAVALDRTLLFGSQELDNFGDEPDEWGVCFLFDTTTVRYVRDDPAGTAQLDAFVVEFTVAAGVTVQRGSIVNGSGVTVGTDAISAVVLSRSFAHCPMAPNASSTEANDQNTLMGSIEFNSTTEVEANTTDSLSTETLFYEVIEFPAGVSPITATATVGAQANAALKGRGRLEATATVGATANADLDGRGVLDATEPVGATSNAELKPFVRATATELVGATANADLQGRGRLEATEPVGATANAALKAIGRLEATANVGATVSADLSDLGQLRATEPVGATANAALKAKGRLEATANVGATANVDLNGRGALDATEGVGATANADLNATGRLEATEGIGAIATADLKGAGKLEATESVGAQANGVVSATVNIAATANVGATANADLDGKAFATATTSVGATATADLNATGKLEATVNVGATANAALSLRTPDEGELMTAEHIPPIPMTADEVD